MEQDYGWGSIIDGMKDAAPPIACEGLTKDYGRLRALDGLDLTVERGEIFGFLGPNGAGKTTTIRLFTGFLRPTAGRARIFGHDCWREGTLAREAIGFLPDIGSLYEEMTGRELLRYLGRFYRRPPALQAELCERFELAAADLARPIRAYSKGMKQKVRLIQAFQHDPELVILDEPAEGLDPLMQREVFGLLKEYRARGRTVFLSSHILSDVEQLCDRVGIVRRGKLVDIGSIDELRRRFFRRLEVTLARPQDISALLEAGARPLATDGLRLRFAVTGDVNAVVRALASLDLAEVVLEPASLEDVFMAHYEGA